MSCPVRARESAQRSICLFWTLSFSGAGPKKASPPAIEGQHSPPVHRFMYGRFRRRRRHALAFARFRRSALRRRSSSRGRFRRFKKARSLRGRRRFRRIGARRRRVGRFRSRLRRFRRGSRRLAVRVRRLSRRVARVARNNLGRRPPPDFFQSSTGTSCGSIGAGACGYMAVAGWGYYGDIRALWDQAVADGSGAHPTLLVKGHTKLELANPTAGDAFFEIRRITPVADTGPFGSDWFAPANFLSIFADSWNYSFASRQSGFEFFPTTQMGQNWAFWQPKHSAVKLVGRPQRVKVPPGSVRTLRYKHRARFGWLDFEEQGLDPSAAWRGKTDAFLIRVRFATGIVIGSTTSTDPPLGGYPVIGPVGGDFAVKSTNYYSFRWVPGNTAPNQSGSWLPQYASSVWPGTVSVSGTAEGFAPDLANRRAVFQYTRGLATGNPGWDSRTWGPWAQYSGAGGAGSEFPINRVIDVNINPLGGGGFTPSAFKPGVDTS